MARAAEALAGTAGRCACASRGGAPTCRKLMAIKMRLYELIPPVKTSLRSLCRRNCFNTKIR